MSQLLEDESPSLSGPAGLARLELEFIGRLNSDASNLTELLARQERENLAAVQAAADSITTWLTSGASLTAMPKVLANVLGRRRRGPRPALTSEAVKDIVRDAKAWLNAIAPSISLLRDNDQICLLLPFLDSFEARYVVSTEAPARGWEATAVSLLQRRIAYCCGRDKAPTLGTLLRLAFSPAAAIRFRGLRLKPLSVPARITPITSN